MDILDQMFAAFDGDDLGAKNAALALGFAEVERLRAALRDIAQSYDATAYTRGVARAALAPPKR